MNFLDIEINGTLLKKIIIASLILICVYMALTMSSLLIFKTYTLGQNNSVDDNNKVKTHIDLLAVEDKKIEITGWAYKEGEKIETVNSNFVLKNQDTGKMYLMRTVMEENDFVEEMGYSHCGLHAQCLKLGLPKGRYQIFVLYKNNDEDILSDTLIPFEI